MDSPYITLVPVQGVCVWGQPGAPARPLTVLCKGCKSWGLVYEPPRWSVDVCERVWWGQRRTLCSGRGQRPGAKLGTVSS